MTSDSVLLWIVFNAFVLGMLALDLLVFHRKAHAVSLREAFTWSVVWISLALIFNLGIYYLWGSEKAMEFLAGYLIEKSLSVDNIFVFIMIFSYFAVPPMYQHRILFWGILGALIMRAIFIAAGAALLSAFHWIIYIFGGFLIITGIKMFFAGDEKIDPEKNPAVVLLRRWMPITKDYQGQRFFVRIDGRRWATPLFVVLLVIETTDVIFAVDSIPAIFAITTRSLHRLHVQHIRHFGPARPLLSVGRNLRDVPLSKGRAFLCPVFRWHQDDDRRFLQDSHRGLLGGGGRNTRHLNSSFSGETEACGTRHLWT